jgi:hypothetical protein
MLEEAETAYALEFAATVIGFYSIHGAKNKEIRICFTTEAWYQSQLNPGLAVQ